MKNLKRKGHRIPVTNSNKMEYIDLMVNWRLRVSTAEQSDALVKGFREVGRGGGRRQEGRGGRGEGCINISLCIK